MPTLDTLHSLATVFRVNPQRLYDLIVEDRLVSSMAVPDELEQVDQEFRQALTDERWQAALALSIHGESLSDTEAESQAWRGRRVSPPDSLSAPPSRDHPRCRPIEHARWEYFSRPRTAP